MNEIKRILAPNMLWVCIDSCETKDFSGKMYSIMREQPIVFQNFHQCILLADQLFDEIAFPQAFEVKRTFNDKEEQISYSSRKKHPVQNSDYICCQSGQLYTCLIAVESRQHANWQGKLLSTDFQLMSEFSDIVHLLNTFIKEINEL